MSTRIDVAASKTKVARFRWSRVGINVILWLYAFIAISPLLLMVYNSFRPSRDIRSAPIGLPENLSVQSYIDAWEVGAFSTYFVNSMVVTICAVALSTAVSLPAAYAIARWSFRGSRVVESIFTSGLMIPLVVVILPLFYLYDSYGLTDSRLGLVLTYATNGIPFSIFVFAMFFRQLPDELEEAAMIDGANQVSIFARVMLPLVRPAVATVVIFRFTPIWNDFLYPLVLIRSPENRTIPVGITMFFGEYSTNVSMLFSGLVIATLPLVLIFIFATKQIVEGLTAGIGK